jgi:hypothetical protein
MMNRLALLFVAPTLLVGLSAQSNTVAGLDGRLTVVDNLTYYGRRGPSHPNGEIGMAMLNTMCNTGTVNIPWFAAMQPDHPMFGFIIARVHNDKIEQINEWSFCKHAFTSINVNGQCGTCQNPGTGSLMGIDCSDTYAAGNNASRTWLGPPEEIDPWLGEWNPVGSYFDIGDPAQAGYPAPADGTRSLSQSIFDSVDNRVTVKEVDLTTVGASYYYALQLIHKGESLANRGDNLAHRGMTPTFGGTNWNFSNNSEGQQFGSVISRWPGSTVNSASNGTDDGRLYVASKVTNLGSGNYHYEYAVHNVDNSRAGGSLRIPIDASAVATNMSFGDIDSDAGNDWSMARVGNEIVFTATATNPIEWDTIYNFGFDANFAPGTSMCEIDEARPGAGAPFVSIETEVPGGSTIATFVKFGAGCPVSQMIPIGQCQQLNTLGGILLNTTSSAEYVYRIPQSGATTVVGFDIYTRSTTGGSVTVPAYIYSGAGSVPSNVPLATGSITVGPNPGFYTASFSSPVSVSGLYYIGLDTSGQDVVLSDLSTGAFGLGYQRANSGAGWGFQLMKPSWHVRCTNLPLFPVPVLDADALPLIGSTYNLTLTDGIPSSAAVLVSGLSSTGPVGVPLLGAPGCDLYATPTALDLTMITAAGTASLPITIPNSTVFTGVIAYHQWAVLDVGANQLGIVMSDGGIATVGQ